MPMAIQMIGSRIGMSGLVIILKAHDSNSEDVDLLEVSDVIVAVLGDGEWNRKQSEDNCTPNEVDDTLPL
jgi:hypothetical protein